MLDKLIPFCHYSALGWGHMYVPEHMYCLYVCIYTCYAALSFHCCAMTPMKFLCEHIYQTYLVPELQYKYFPHHK